jgi:hypothetical protein
VHKNLVDFDMLTDREIEQEIAANRLQYADANEREELQ